MGHRPPLASVGVALEVQTCELWGDLGVGPRGRRESITQSMLRALAVPRGSPWGRRRAPW